MNTIKRGILIGIVVALTAGSAAAVAQERPTDTTVPASTETDRQRPLAELKERAQNLINFQQAILDRLGRAVGNSRFITDGHAGQLRADFARLDATLEHISRQVEDAETLEQVWGLIREVHALHIGEVTAPKTHQVIASDSMVVIGGKLERFAAKLEELLTRAEEAGYDVSEGWVLLEEMNRYIASGIALADPVAESVIDLDGDDWPDPAQDLLAAGRRDLHAAGTDLRHAYADGRDIVELLRSL